MTTESIYLILLDFVGWGSFVLGLRLSFLVEIELSTVESNQSSIRTP